MRLPALRALDAVPIARPGVSGIEQARRKGKWAGVSLVLQLWQGGHSVEYISSVVGLVEWRVRRFINQYRKMEKRYGGDPAQT